MIRLFLKNLLWSDLVLAGCAAGAVLGGFVLAQRPAKSAIVQEAAHEVSGEWLPELRPAIALAKSQHKDILLEFSHPADKPLSVDLTEDRVLDTEAFRRSAGEAFVLVRFTISEQSSPAHLTEVTSWAQRLGVARFPTFVLMDSGARPYAKSELSASDADTYTAEFRRLLQVRVDRDEALMLAAKSLGKERAKLLNKALSLVGKFADSEYVDIERQVVELDPQNVAGLKAKYAPAVIVRDLDAVIQSEIYPLVDRGNYGAAVARIDRLISEIGPPRPQLQLLTAFKGQLYYSLGDKQRAAKLLDDAIALDPQSESAARARAAKSQLAGLR